MIGMLSDNFSLKPTAVDVGAASGLHLPFNPLLSTGSKIVMIEPGQERFAELKEKYRDAKNVEIYDVGLWDKDGSFDLHFCDTRGASLFKPDLEVCRNYVDEHLDGHPTGKVCQVEVRKAEPFLRSVAKVEGIDFIKLDTQGCELDILKDLGPLLDETVSVITESPLSARYHGQPSISEYLDFFVGKGFELFDITLNKALRTRAPRRFDFIRDTFGVHGYPANLKGRVMDGDLLVFRKPGWADTPKRVKSLAFAYCLYGYHLDAYCLLLDSKGLFQADERERAAWEKSLKMLADHIAASSPFYHRSGALYFVKRALGRLRRTFLTGQR